jgi:PAS domain S-box-containing protein
VQDTEHLRLVVEAAPIAIIVADDEGLITLLNERGARVFGYEPGELLGRPVESLVPERFRGGHEALRDKHLRESMARVIGEDRDLYGLCKDGSEVALEIGLHPIATPQGNFTLAVVTDITERKNAEELRRRDRALDASELKSQFVATMSHELRTPLNAIIGTAELLGNSLLDERQRAYVASIETSAEALLAVISTILDFSKIWAGRVDLEAQDFELAALLTAAAGVVAQKVQHKGLTLETYVDPRIPRALRGDPDRLRQILLNLVGNAVKFTARGHIAIRALPAEVSGQYVTVRFEVADTGIGIAPEILPQLFSPFVQGDGSASRKYGGTGLGLSISKRLVELMQGAIGVTSEPAAGSLFWFTARLGRVGGGARQPEPRRETQMIDGIVEALGGDAAAGRSNPEVLVAEDNAGLQTVLVHQFEVLGVPLTLVGDGMEAVAAVRRKRFALVFMDCQMPNLDGFAATRAIRDDERTTGLHVPIVAVTANAFKEDRQVCLAAGMDDYLSKPVRINDFRTMIERWIAPVTADT